MTPICFLRRFTVGITAAALLIFGAPAVGAEPQNDWTSFRADARNNGVVHAAAPRSGERSALLWEAIYGLGYPGPAILAEDALICVHGGYADFGTLTRIDPRDGTLLAAQETDSSPTWNTAPPCYGDGRIYCQLDGGMVQAFDARSLEPLWIFKKPTGGKAHNPIVFRDGRLYVGFGYEASGVFLCLDAETGSLIWKQPTPRGQFAAGALVAGDFVIYGDETGSLTVRKKETGELVQSLALSGGPIRCGVCYAEGKLFCTGYNGHLYYAPFDEAAGKVGQVTDVDCTGYGLHSLSTPTVYDSYVYLALGSQGGGENNVVCVDTVSGEIAWAVPVGSNPTCSVLLSDACRDQGSLYLYVTAGWGGITVLRVPTDGSQPQAEELFLPEINAQPGACSLTAAADGTLYYTNNSSAIFAVTADEAWLDSLTGSTGRFAEIFTPGETQYTYLVPAGTQEVSFTAQSPAQVSLNGGDVSLPVTLTEGAALAEFNVSDGRFERTYVLNIQEESDDAGLAQLTVCNGGTDQALALIPEFQPGVSEYTVFTVDSAPSQNSVTVLPVPNAAHSQVAVYARSNVRPGAFDRETMEIYTESPELGYEIPFEDQSKPIEIDLVVTAENGNLREYHLLLSKAQSAIQDIGQVSPERSSWVSYARSVCDSLTEEQLALLPNYSVLQFAEQQLAEEPQPTEATEATVAAAEEATEETLPPTEATEETSPTE